MANALNAADTEAVASKEGPQDRAGGELGRTRRPTAGVGMTTGLNAETVDRREMVAVTAMPLAVFLTGDGPSRGGVACSMAGLF